MNNRELKTLIEEGEGFGLEFKRKVSTPEKTARALIGFANTRGGTILFGVDDDKSIVGVESEKLEIEMIQSAGRLFCDPPIEPEIEIVGMREKDVIVVSVSESASKPHMLVNGSNGDSSKVFIRVNDKTVEASKEVVRVLRAESPDAPPMHFSIGEEERRLLDYLDSHEQITLQEFAKLVNISRRRASRALVQLVRAGVIRIHTHEHQEFFTRA